MYFSGDIRDIDFGDALRGTRITELVNALLGLGLGKIV
jgi:hypothetical protein